jgi:cytidylate kinase
MEKGKVNLIGISGKMGSGKDTAAMLIKRILSNKELTDNTIAHLVKNPNGTVQDNSGWQIKKFSTKLKEVVAVLTGAPVEKLDDQNFKKHMIGEHWDMTFRELMQKIGTEAMRNVINQDVWVNSLFDSHDEYKTYGEFRKWIITDVRFKNEAAAIKSRKGIILRIENDRCDKSDHTSETELDNFSFDYTIDNNSSIEDLAIEIRKFCEHFKLI